MIIPAMSPQQTGQKPEYDQCLTKYHPDKIHCLRIGGLDSTRLEGLSEVTLLDRDPYPCPVAKAETEAGRSKSKSHFSNSHLR